MARLASERGSKRPMLAIVKFNTTNLVYNIRSDEKSYLNLFAEFLLCIIKNVETQDTVPIHFILY